MDIARMREAHEILAEHTFDSVELERGYANRTLRIDIGTKEVTINPVTQQMKDLWIGGKGFDLWLMFQEMTKDTTWESPENPICFASGPLGGVSSFPGAGKTIVTSISPTTESIIDSNVGGNFGPFLKFTGFDAMSVVGKAEEETIIVIDGIANKITIEKAPLESVDAHVISEELTEMYADDYLDRRNISVISAGTAANYCKLGVLNFSFYDWRRGVARLKQAGRGGIGTVFRDKKLKAIVIKQRKPRPGWNITESKPAKAAKAVDTSKCACGHDHLQEVRDIALSWGNDPEFVIEMLQDIQDAHRCISKEALDELALVTMVPQAYLYHIATFYKAFSLEPRGETVIQVCMGTACHVKGSARIADELERVLGIGRGQTTEDGKFSLEAVACLGACSIAPVVKIGEEVVGNVEVKDVAKLIEKRRSSDA